MLNFEHQWRFDSPGKVPDGVITDFRELVGKIATQGSRWSVLETFKSYFANASGVTSYPSTSESWAETDLITNMEQAADNAALFIEAFYDACEAFRSGGDYAVPDVTIINGSIRDSYVFVIDCLERQEVGLWTSGVSRCGFRRRAG